MVARIVTPADSANGQASLIGEEHDDCVVGQAVGLQSIEDFAHSLVQAADTIEISGPVFSGNCVVRVVGRQRHLGRINDLRVYLRAESWSTFRTHPSVSRSAFPARTLGDGKVDLCKEGLMRFQIVPVVGVEQTDLVLDVLNSRIDRSTLGGLLRFSPSPVVFSRMAEHRALDLEVVIDLAVADHLSAHGTNVGCVIADIDQALHDGTNAVRQMEVIVSMLTHVLCIDTRRMHAGDERRPAGGTDRNGAECRRIAHCPSGQVIQTRSADQ